MPRHFDLTDELALRLLDGVPAAPPTEPRAYYNEHGDCIEFLFSDETYYAERVDGLLTVYYGRDSGEIVGSLIKGVRRFLGDFSKSAPGFKIEVVDGRVRLEHIFTAGLWNRSGGETDGMVVKTYKKLRETADDADLEVDVPHDCAC